MESGTWAQLGLSITRRPRGWVEPLGLPWVGAPPPAPGLRWCHEILLWSCCVSGNALSCGKWTRPLGCHPGHQGEASGIHEGIAEAVCVRGHSGTSKDGDANTMCSALEAVFVYGLHAKHIVGRDGTGQEGCPPAASASACLRAPPESCHSQTRHLGIGAPDPCLQGHRSLPGPQPQLEGVLLKTAPPGAGPPVPGLSGTAALLPDAEEGEPLSFLQGLPSLHQQLSYRSTILHE